MDPTDPTAITYENVSDMLVEHVPELQAAYQAELKWWGDERPGPHVIYGDILNSYLDQLLQSGDEARLRQLFEFIEVLAGHSDVRVQELVAVTVCEHLGDDPDKLKAARRFMGPLTTRHSREVERFWGRT